MYVIRLYLKDKNIQTFAMASYTAQQHISGFVASRFSEIKLLNSMSPIGGSYLRENLFSYCPALAFIRNVFNPIVRGGGGGSTGLKYVNCPKFVICIFLEHLNYLILKPMNLFQESWRNLCTR